MNSNPPVGAVAYGKSGAGYPVIEVHPDRIVLKRDGQPWAVNPVAIARWEMPEETLVVPEPVTERLPTSRGLGDASELTQADYLDAVGLVEVADNREAIEAVRSALTQVFTSPAEKRRLWEMLNPQQREKLSI